VSGHVRYEDPNHAGAVQFVSLRDEKGRLIRTQMDAEGNYSLTRLPVGHYEVLATSAKYIAAYLIDPSGAQLPLTLDINSGEPVHRDVVLTTAVSAIEGTVEKDGGPQAGAFVLLIPKERRWDYRVDQADSDGSYRLASIPSGDYFLIALSDGENVAYRDAKIAGVLTKAAQTVHLEKGEKVEKKVEVTATESLNLPLH
jgi:hypothetical protein